MRKTSTVRAYVERVRLDAGELVRRQRRDVLVTEEPLEIRVATPSSRGEPDGAPPPIAVTMRTPGADFDLAAGFIYAEGMVDSADQIRSIRYCVNPEIDGRQEYNVVTAELTDAVRHQPELHQRNFYTTSSCGLCGKASIDSVLALPTAASTVTRSGTGDDRDPVVSAETLIALPGILRESQAVFARTGGLHAAALFSPAGAIVRVREDIGRHNALDKLFGASLLARELPLDASIVLVSGRLGFELVQKAARAGVRVLAGVSAPSSLAVELADAVGMTLVGFLREGRFNIYAGAGRIMEGRVPDTIAVEETT